MTVDGQMWLLVFAPKGSFVAREDSPAARHFLRRGSLATRFVSLEDAYAARSSLRKKDR